jgi:hypothetical protein
MQTAMCLNHGNPINKQTEHNHPWFLKTSKRKIMATFKKRQQQPSSKAPST